MNSAPLAAINPRIAARIGCSKSRLSIACHSPITPKAAPYAPISICPKQARFRERTVKLDPPATHGRPECHMQ